MKPKEYTIKFSGVLYVTANSAEEAYDIAAAELGFDADEMEVTSECEIEEDQWERSEVE